MLALAAHPISSTVYLVDEDISELHSVAAWYEAPEASVSSDEIWSMLGSFSSKDFQEKRESEKDYWAYLQLKNNRDYNHTDWVIEFDLGVTDIDAYLRRESGEIEEHRSGYFNVKTRTYDPIVKGNMIAIDIDPDETIELVIKLHSSRKPMPPILDMSMSSLIQFESKLRSRQSRNMAYLGFILMMLVFTILLFGLSLIHI